MPNSSKEIDSHSLTIKKKPLMVLWDVLALIGILVFTELLQIYYKHQRNYSINLTFACITFLTILISFSLYLLLYFKLIYHRKPSKIVTVERWFTVRPKTCYLIMIMFGISFIFGVITLWPNFGKFGLVYCILVYSLLYQLPGYIPC